MVDAGLIVIKLLLGLAAFLLIGYVGKFHDQRITGVLLTFPILNGIAMLAGADPLAVAASIYPLAMFNSLLFCAAITWGDAWPPLARVASRERKLTVRLAAWSAIWLLGAVSIMRLRDWLPGALPLFLMQAALAASVLIRGWTLPASPPQPEVTRAGPRRHLHDFLSLWTTRDAGRRIALFVACFAAVLIASYCFDAAWVGMASALPLPGLFALATLSVLEPPKRLTPIRDTVLLGPLLAIAFNWILAQVLLQIPSDRLVHAAIGIAATLLLWGAAAAVTVWGVPALAARMDRWRGRPRGAAQS